jgi:hypothetical protein
MKNTNNAEKLLEKFANKDILDGKNFTFRAYSVERNGNYYLTQGRITHLPAHMSGTLYFVAEVTIELSNRGGSVSYQHYFQLDLASIKIELDKIAKLDPIHVLYHVKGIVNVLNEHYYEIANWLKDYNGTQDNYPEIAKLLYKHKDRAVAPNYGL